MRIELPSGLPRTDAEAIRVAYNSATMASTHAMSKSAMAPDVMLATPRMWSPERYGMATPYDAYGGQDILDFDTNEAVREDILLACRNIEKTHPVIHAAVQVYSRYPLQGLRLEHEDKEIQRFYEDLFLSDLAFDEFLVDVGRCFWVDGTAFVYGNWSDELGLWVGEDIIDPLCMQVEHIPIIGQDIMYLTPTQEMRDALRADSQTGAIFSRQNPDMAKAILSGNPIVVSPDRCTMIAMKDRPSERYGTPVMLRAWNTLRIESRMHSAMQATADRLYAPLLMFTVGGRLPDGTDYIPSARALDAFRANLDAALSSDFRAIVTHSGVQSTEVIRQANLNSFKQDIDMYDERVLMAFGLSTSLLKPSSQNYASSALEFQLAAQIMSSYQRTLANVYEKQAAMVAEAQGHYAKDENGDTVYELREVWDDDEGDYVVKKVPKLDFPALKFEVINFRNEQDERKFRMELKREGMPISDDDLAIGVDIDLEASRKRYNEEQVTKKTDESRRNMAIFKSLWEQGLPIPPDVAKYMNDAITKGDAKEIVDRWRDVIDSSSATYDSLQIDHEPEDKRGLTRVVKDDEISTDDNEGDRPDISDEQRKGMPTACRKG
jgi:hypothetical protein